MRRAGRFFRNMWYLSTPYFRSEEKWSAWGLLLLVLAANVVIVRINVVANATQGIFFNALQQYDEAKFFAALLTYVRDPDGPFGIVPGFVPLFALNVLIFANGRYMHQWLEIRWRRWMTARFQQEWLNNRAYYLMQLQPETLGNDNPDQRISEDINSFVSNGLTIGLGFVSNIVSLASFLSLLWALSFPIVVFGVSIPGYLVWVALIYSFFASVLAHLIGRPLVRLNFIRQRLEADFRFALVRLRENAEGVALYRGEADESRILGSRFASIIANFRRLMSRYRYLNYYTNFIDAIAGFFPFVAAAPVYFAKTIPLGTVTRVAGAFGEVQSAASWLVDNYTNLADWAATLDRLATFQRSLDALRDTPPGIVAVTATGPDLLVRNLELELPNGERLLETAELRVPRGANTVITGRSGSGKSTLFRALAGIWPFGHGQVALPARTMFLPQNAYIPLGTLRRAVAYPADPEAFASGEVEQALTAAGLSGLIPELDVDMAWAQRLSGGEQQRVALARALLSKPDWLFLDEATSGLDPAGEAEVYRVLREHLPGTTLVSIAHRPDVAAGHDQQLELDRGSRRTTLRRSEPIVPAK